MTDLITLRNKALLRMFSPMEQKIFDFLRQNKIPFAKEYVHKTLINPQTGYNLYIDFYLPEHRIAIEYNGKQHYIDKDAGRLTQQKHRDRVKAKWCRHNKIHLITIPYNKQGEYVEILNKELKIIKKKTNGRDPRIQTEKDVRSINKRAIRQKRMEKAKRRIRSK